MPRGKLICPETSPSRGGISQVPQHNMVYDSMTYQGAPKMVYHTFTLVQIKSNFEIYRSHDHMTKIRAISQKLIKVLILENF